MAAYLLHHLLGAAARATPDQVAVQQGDLAMPYIDLDRRANAYGRLLTELGVARFDRVGIHLRRGVDAIAAATGASRLGAIYVPLDPLSPAARLAGIVDRAGARVLVTDSAGVMALDAAWPDGSAMPGIVIVDRLAPATRPRRLTVLAQGADVAALPRDPLPDAGSIDADPAYILFTSGSTGEPKGVVLSHRNALTFVESARETFDIRPADRLSHICPLHFDMSVFDVYVAFAAGATCIVIPEVAAMFPMQLATAIDQQRISVWNSVPTALVGVADLERLPELRLSNLRLVLFAGEVFPVPSLRRLMEALPGARFCNLYGQTEANSSTCHWIDRLPEPDAGPLPIGRPLPNFDVVVLDDAGDRVEGPGREGELYVRAHTVALGYWGDDERTERAFVPDPIDPTGRGRAYRTGDVVRYDDAGRLVFVGRRDHMVKSRGYRIELGEIEAVLSQLPDVDQAVAVAVPDERIGHRLVAVIRPKPSGELSADAVRSACTTRLPRYMVPDEIRIRTSLPLTSSGKVDRTRVLEAS